MTLMLSSMWWKFLPFPSIWRNFTSFAIASSVKYSEICQNVSNSVQTVVEHLYSLCILLLLPPSSRKAGKANCCECTLGWDDLKPRLGHKCSRVGRFCPFFRIGNCGSPMYNMGNYQMFLILVQKPVAKNKIKILEKCFL